jgi:hypothetical protein
MGYETTIYVGQPSKHKDPSVANLTWFQTFAQINCSCLGGGLVTEEVVKAGIPCYIFESDGDTIRSSDRYGTNLVAVPIKKVIEGLKEILKTEKYSRAQWAYDALRSMKKKRKGYHGKVATHCILFGH